MARERVAKQTRDCVVCFSSKAISKFPQSTPTAACTHPIQTCSECLAASIKSDLRDNIWTKDVICCPQCPAPLAYSDVEKFGDADTFSLYATRLANDACSELPNFIQCTAVDCMAGQIHDGGADHPIVTCFDCGRKSCFLHRVPWHDELTCTEYDERQKDPVNFRCKRQIEDEEMGDGISGEEKTRLDGDSSKTYG